MSEERIKQDLFYNLQTLSSLVDRLPIALSQLLDDLEAQRLQISVRDPEAAQRDQAADRRLNRGIMAAFTLIGFLCSALSLPVQGLLVAGIPVLSIVFLLAALPFGALTLSMIFWNRG